MILRANSPGSNGFLLFEPCNHHRSPPPPIFLKQCIHGRFDRPVFRQNRNLKPWLRAGGVSPEKFAGGDSWASGQLVQTRLAAVFGIRRPTKARSKVSGALGGRKELEGLRNKEHYVPVWGVSFMKIISNSINMTLYVNRIVLNNLFNYFHGLAVPLSFKTAAIC